MSLQGEKLTVRKRGGCKRARGTRAPMTIPQEANQRWSVDFVSDTLDTLADSRRFRVLCVIDDFSPRMPCSRGSRTVYVSVQVKG